VAPKLKSFVKSDLSPSCVTVYFCRAITLVLRNCRHCNGPIVCPGSLQTRLTKSGDTNFMAIQTI